MFYVIFNKPDARVLVCTSRFFGSFLIVEVALEIDKVLFYESGH